MIFPIEQTSASQSKHSSNGFITIEEALKSRNTQFSECATPDIDTILFDNNSGYPVLMIDGEEVTGALQNRIIARSEIIQPRQSTKVPVVCAEEGRWEGLGGFRTGYCSYPQLRALITKSRQKTKHTQELVWQEITRKLTETRTRSTTSSMHDIYDHLDDEVERYLEGFHTLNHRTVGIVGTAGNRILGCDIFAYPALYHKFERKLLRSYALDAIEFRRKRGSPADINSFFSTLNASTARIRCNRPHFKIRKEGLIGQGLVHGSRIIHLSAFPT
jgi:hypothetical protein